MPPPIKPPDQADPTAPHVAIRIFHIFEAIVIACDLQTVTRLARTSKWVRGAVETVEAHQVHVLVEEGQDMKRYDRLARGFRNSRVKCGWDVFFPPANRDSDRLHITIDLKGLMTPEFDSNAQDQIANVVRLVSHLKSNTKNDAWIFGGCSSPFVVSYPKYMPRARSVVAFPFPFDRWEEKCLPPFLKPPLDVKPKAGTSYFARYPFPFDRWEEKGRPPSLKPPLDVKLKGDTTCFARYPEWVFDRVVYHTAHEHVQFCWDWETYSSSIPNLHPAWHSLFLVPPQSGTNNKSLAIWDRITYAAAIALQQRTWIPGAHVTIVINTPARGSTLMAQRSGCDDQDPITDPVTKESLLALLRTNVQQYLVDQNDTDFILDCQDAVNIVSWDEYKASISSRQFELENFQC